MLGRLTFALISLMIAGQAALAIDSAAGPVGPALTESFINDYLVSGHGAPRSSLKACEAEVGDFEQALKDSGLVPVERIYCIAITGESAQFVPKFRAKIDVPVAVETTSGPKFSSHSYCEVERLRMAANPGKGVSTIESTCKRIRAPSSEEGSDEAYMPVLVTMGPQRDFAAVVVYDTLDLMVKSSEAQKMKAYLNSNLGEPVATE